MNHELLRELIRENYKMLTDRGWTKVGAMLVDDARKEGVADFGVLFMRDGEKFWLNYKTINNLPSGRNA